MRANDSRLYNFLSMLLGYLDTMPKCDKIAKVSTNPLDSAIFWSRIVPGGVLVCLTLYDDIIITCLAFPGTNSMRITRFQKIHINAFRRKIVVAFDTDRLVALRQYLAIPDCFWHVTSLGYLSLIVADRKVLTWDGTAPHSFAKLLLPMHRANPQPLRCP